jgi:hypothetical protein
MKQQQQTTQETTTRTKTKATTYLVDGIYNEMFKAKSSYKEDDNNISSISIIPIAFTTVPLYVEKRHEEIQNIIKQDI